MHLLKKLHARLGGSLFIARHVPDGVTDKLLRRADKHANAKGAELLGLTILDLQNDDIGAGAPVEDALGDDGLLVCVGFNTNVSPTLLARCRGCGRGGNNICL